MEALPEFVEQTVERHSFSPYFEGMDNLFEQFDSEENQKQYEKEQRQRILERRIRDTKREVLGLKQSLDNCEDDALREVLDREYQRKSALLAKQNKAYKDYCEKNGLKPLQDRLNIAQWNRKQAAAARGAAKRYENAHGGSVEKNVSKAVADEPQVTNIIKIKSINESVDKLKEIGFTSVDKKVLNLDEKIVVNSVNQLQDLENKFGAIKKTECSFSVDASFFQEERAKGAIAGVDDKLIADGTDYNYDLSINSTFFNDRDRTIKQQKLSMEKDYTMPCGEDFLDSYAVTHEYGHLLQDSLLNEQFKELSIEYKKVKNQYDSVQKTINSTTNIKEKIELSDKIYDLSDEMQIIKGKMRKSWDLKEGNAKKINEEIISIAKDLLRKEDEDFANLSDEEIEVTGFMSRYGRTTAYEFFAEAFANSQCGKPNLLGNAMNIWLKKKGYKL